MFNVIGYVVSLPRSLNNTHKGGVMLSTEKMKGYAPPSRVSDYWTLLSHVTPSFDNSYPKNVTTQLGQTVYLHCVVNNLGDKTVSTLFWYHILV
ncbi:hypothetical protein AVEN_190266-1 [Araneus ventricosus]|uniref:Ig-like domain-containing protein n=1 Tax=Araneus ventricosus TaxID=182803 RepID=A0A4Y2TIR5_ARAVE|nr:hypothetical protein AVEN_190266-1 [Araneus ventricosus]